MTRPNDPDFIDIYYKALKTYTEDQVISACDECLVELKFFPKPMEIRKRLPAPESQKPEKFHMYEGRCACGHVGMVIQEPTGTSPRCRECYTGLSSQQVKKRFRDLHEMMRDREYRPEWVRRIRREA